MKRKNGSPRGLVAPAAIAEVFLKKMRRGKY